MMRFSLASLALVSAEPSWQEWKFQYGVAYNGADEDLIRQVVYEANVQQINDHNAQGKTWTLAVNAFGDRTREEFLALVASPWNKTTTEEEGTFAVELPEASLPSSKDWQSVFNPVRDQQNSDCWAHSAVGVLESNWEIATGNKIQLTEQQLCDCAHSAGTCQGGGEEEAQAIHSFAVTPSFFATTCSPLNWQMVALPRRWAWTFLKEGVSFRAGRLYETFWNSQSNVKWSVVFLYPGALFWVRWRAETQYKYNVFVADDAVKPDDSNSLFFSWKNGPAYYLTAMATVKDLKEKVYEGNVPPAVRAGCHGRMMEDSDNLALAVRTFCRRDPRIVFWEEETEK